jgi:hypothetical protein
MPTQQSIGRQLPISKPAEETQTRPFPNPRKLPAPPRSPRRHRGIGRREESNPVTAQGLDPKACRAFAHTVSSSARSIISLAADLRVIDHQGLLSMADPSCKLLSETFDELSMLATLLQSKASAMEGLDSGVGVAWALNKDAQTNLAKLEASLNDQTGNNGVVGDNVLKALADNFDAIDTDSDGNIGKAELEKAAKSKDLTVQASAKYLLANPALHAAVITAQTRISSSGRNGYFEWGADGKEGQTFDDATFNRSDLVAITEQNAAIRTLLNDWKQLEGDVDQKISMKEIDAVLRTGAGSTYSAELVAACQYLKDNEKAFSRIDGVSSVRLNAFGSNDGKIHLNDLLTVAVDQQALIADAKLAQEMVVTQFPNIAFTDDVMDIRLVSDDGLKALAASALSASPTLRMQAETVAFLPENTSGIRNQLITAYYVKIGAAKTAWLNPKLADPLDVSDPGSTGLDWLVIGANASNSVSTVINGDAKLPYVGWDLAASERNQMAEGNQRIFTDVAVRNAALMERFPTGQAVDPLVLKDFLSGARYSNKELMFNRGDRQMRDAMLFSLAAREEADPAKRRQLSFMATASTAIHEQASIQNQLEGIFGGSWSDEGIRGPGAEALTRGIGSTPEEMGTRLLGVLKFGDFGTPGPSFNLQRDLDAQKKRVTLPTNNPIGNLDLTTDLSPATVKSVTINGKLVALDGSSLQLANLAGWETVKGSDNKNFEIDPKVWKTNGGKSNAKRPLEGTGATDWTDYEQRMWYIDNLFQQYTFEPKVLEWNKTFTSGKTSDLSFLPADIKKSLNEPN